MEQKLFDASLAGKVDDFKRILRNNLDLVNWRNEKFSGWSPLHQACSNKHSAIVSLLLAHPDVDVNLKDNFGDVPFAYAQDGAVLRLLLADTRVKINEPNTGGETALSQASKKGNLEAVKWIIASGRQLDGTATDALNAAQNPVRQEYEIEDQVFVARKEQCSLVERLLIKYADSPETTTKEVRAELGLKGHLPTHTETAHFNSSTLFFFLLDFAVDTPVSMTNDEYITFLGGQPGVLEPPPSPQTTSPPASPAKPATKTAVPSARETPRPPASTARSPASTAKSPAAPEESVPKRPRFAALRHIFKPLTLAGFIIGGLSLYGLQTVPKMELEPIMQLCNNQSNCEPVWFFFLFAPFSPIHFFFDPVCFRIGKYKMKTFPGLEMRVSTASFASSTPSGRLWAPTNSAGS